MRMLQAVSQLGMLFGRLQAMKAASHQNLEMKIRAKTRLEMFIEAAAWLDPRASQSSSHHFAESCLNLLPLILFLLLASRPAPPPSFPLWARRRNRIKRSMLRRGSVKWYVEL